jgi:ubiquitin-like 1-activating enzyme E1 B
MIFSVEDYVTEFIICAIKLFSRSKGFDGRNQLTFEKDDDHIMKFVTAASNLRSHIFSIPLTSYYDAKGYSFDGPYLSLVTIIYCL